MALFLGDKLIGTNSIGTRVEEKDVNFYDYEGTLVASYTKQEALALTSLPPLPDRTSENLTNEGWNMSISDITSMLNEGYSCVAVGCTYHTTDGKTYLYANPIMFQPTVYIALQAELANDVTIDWGDGNSYTLTSTNIIHLEHTYSSDFLNRDIIITISSTSGNHIFPSYFFGYTNANNEVNRIKKAILSSKAKLDTAHTGTYCGFVNFKFLEILSLSKYNYSGSGNYDSLFSSCISLKHVNLPNTFPSVTNRILMYCHSLKRASIPINVGGNSACNSCYQLDLSPLKVNNNITTSYYFSCRNINFDIYINSTELGDRTIYDSFVENVTISNAVTNINYRAFQSCTLLKNIYIKATTPPTLSSAFTAPNAFYIIWVPRASYNDYITASNWADIASHIQPYDY